MRLLAATSAGAGLLQFLINPSIGKLSDTFGRKLFFLAGPSFNVISNALIALRPSNYWLWVVLRVLDDVLTTLSGSTTSFAAISDCASGEDLAVATARLGTFIGLGVALGPLLGDSIFIKFGYRMVYASKVAVALIHLLFVSTLPETLPKVERRPFASFISPFSFTELFRNGPCLRKLCSTGGLQQLVGAKNVNDLEQIWFVDVVQMPVALTTVYVIYYGFMQMLGGGLVTPALLKCFGSRLYTSMTNGTNFLAHVLWGVVPRPWAMFAAITLALPGVDANSSIAVKTMACDVAQELKTKRFPRGMGRGEYQGYFANLSALAVAIGPGLYGFTYAWGRQYFPRINLGFLLAAVVGCLLPELVHLSLTREERTFAEKSGRGD